MAPAVACALRPAHRHLQTPISNPPFPSRQIAKKAHAFATTDEQDPPVEMVRCRCPLRHLRLGAARTTRCLLHRLSAAPPTCARLLRSSGCTPAQTHPPPMRPCPNKTPAAREPPPLARGQVGAAPPASRPRSKAPAERRACWAGGAAAAGALRRLHGASCPAAATRPCAGRRAVVGAE